MHTVVARFHHLGRDLAALEADLVARGARDAQITGYTVAVTIDAETHKEAVDATRRILDRVGATRIKITKHGSRPVPALGGATHKA